MPRSPKSRSGPPKAKVSPREITNDAGAGDQSRPSCQLPGADRARSDLSMRLLSCAYLAVGSADGRASQADRGCVGRLRVAVTLVTFARYSRDYRYEFSENHRYLGVARGLGSGFEAADLPCPKCERSAPVPRVTACHVSRPHVSRNPETETHQAVRGPSTCTPPITNPVWTSC